MKRLLRLGVEWIVVMASAIIGSLVAGYADVAFESGIRNLNIVTVSNVAAGIALGLPVGSTVGIVLVKRLVRREPWWDPPGLVGAIIVSFLGMLAGGVLLDQVGNWAVPLLPVLAALGAQFGERIGGRSPAP